MHIALRALTALVIVTTPAVAFAAPGDHGNGGDNGKGHGKNSQPATATTAAFTPGLSLLDGNGHNTGAAEPSIQIDSKGNIYASGPVGVPTGGCPFWWIHPGTLNDKGLPYDYRGTIDTDHASVGGGDCDISTSPSTDPTNAARFDDVAVSSLSLANLTTNRTTDGGATWQPVANPVGQQVFGVDRQWQAADQSLNVHYLTVHDLATVNIQTSVSNDGGYTYVQNLPAIDAEHATFAANGVNGNHFGPTVVDQNSHKLYIPFIAPAQGEEAGGSEHAVYIAVGDPCANSGCAPGQPVGPIQWTDYTVFVDTPGKVLSHDFPSLALDKGGNLYLAWAGDTKSSDTNRTWLATANISDPSKWTAPVAVDDGSNHSNVFPWVVAGQAGTVDVTWYASQLSGSGDCTTPGEKDDSTGVNNNCHQDWKVAFAQSTDGGLTFTRTNASDVIHSGGICDQGLSCPSGTRTLLDFFDMDLDPAGGANIVYASDKETPGTPSVVYTRQCTGTSATDGSTLARDCGALVPPPPTLAATTCDGSHAVPDASGDASNPAGPSDGIGTADITNVAFAVNPSDATVVDVTMTLADLEPTPPAGATDTYYYVTWTAPDGKQYGVELAEPAALETYLVGPYDKSANQLTDSQVITGEKTTGPNGTITWHVPRSAIGNPTIPVSAGQTPAIGAPYAVTVLGEGSADVGGLVFTQPADRAPDSGAGSSWQVC